MHSVAKWIGLLSATGAWQLAIAAVGFVSGIAVVRLLDTEQYAIYTIANSLLGALVVLGDSGISSGVMSQGGGVWQDRSKLGAVVKTALHICRWFAVIAAAAAFPAALFLLGRHGASYAVSLAVATILVPCFVMSVRNTILQIPLKLHQDLRPLQAIQLGSNVVRLLLLGAALPLAPFAVVALCVATASTFFANVGIHRRGAKYIASDSRIEPNVRQEIMRIVWRTLPGSTYYCIQGQLTVWLISVFGNTTSVAQFGALGRLTMVTSVVSAVATTLIVPRFARLPNDRPLLLRRLGISALALAVICAAGLFVVLLFPDALLWILGSSYGGLEHELMLMAISSSFGLFGSLVVSLCFSRGLIPNPLIAIPFGLAVQSVLIFLNDMTTLSGVLLMSVGVAVAMTLFYVVYLVLNLGRERVAASHPSV
jgi:O-antigen/teichoic acid export membrane protein